ncbi:MAG: GGDEF domain-containing protein [Desulfobacter sp.]
MKIQIKDLEQMDLFRGIGFDSLPKGLATAPVRSFNTGGMVLSPEAPNATLFLLLSGALTVHLESPYSKPLRTIWPGSCVGELSLIEKTRPSAWVRAEVPSELIALDHNVLWDMLAADGRIAKNLMSILSRRVIDNTELILLGKIRIRELEQASMIDGLTNIYNRRWFDQAMVVHMNRFHRRMIPFTLCMIDIDHFKAYNDVNGHQDGDSALITVARLLVDNLRTEDFVARYGGEEFGVILADTTAKDASGVARHLLDTVRQAEIRDSSGRLLPPVTVSIGFAQPKAGATVRTLIKEADDALYQAKEQGRDCCCTLSC